MSPQISVIVPVYKVEEYLPRCIDSILNQTYSDFELLLINDGSPDNSGKICDEYAQKDPRIRVFHKKNEGVSSARNIGLKYAKGEWIYFADSDDEVNKDGLLILINKVKEYHADFIMGSFEKYDEQGNLLYKNTQNLEKLMTRNRAIKAMFNTIKGEYQGYLWNKIFKKKIINQYNLHFNTQIYFNEDRLFCIEYICKCSNKIYYLSDSIYKYYTRSSSAMGGLSTTFNPKLITDFKAFLLIYQLLQKESFPSMYIIRRCMIYSYHYIIKQMHKYKYREFSIQKQLTNELCLCTFYYERVLWIFLLYLKIEIKKIRNLLKI